MNPLTNMKNVKKLSEQELQGKYKTSWHDQYKDSAWIFVGGLPYDLTEGDIICVFSQYGEIVNINLVRDKLSGKSKGFCFICFEDQRSTNLAVDNFNGIKLLNRAIRVDHVNNYKAPKDNQKLDDETRQLHSEGCAPGTKYGDSSRQSSPSNGGLAKPLELPPMESLLLPKTELEEKAAKKDKKKKKKTKNIFKKKRKAVRSDSESEGSSSSSSEEDEPRRKKKKETKKRRKKSSKSSSNEDSDSDGVKEKNSKKSKSQNVNNVPDEEYRRSRPENSSNDDNIYDRLEIDSLRKDDRHREKERKNERDFEQEEREGKRGEREMNLIKNGRDNFEKSYQKEKTFYKDRRDEKRHGYDDRERGRKEERSDRLGYVERDKERRDDRSDRHGFDRYRSNRDADKYRDRHKRH